VFRALNAAEIGLLALLSAAGLAGSMPSAGWGLVVALGVLLAVQVLLVRPRLDRRTVAIIDGRTPPPSHQHLTYVALEVLKVLALPVLGVVLASRELR
jgi:hypothetical protein